MLGLGPGIDYAAVGEAMAFGQIIKNWRRSYEELEARYETARDIISRQRDLIAQMEALQREGAAHSETAIKAIADQAMGNIESHKAEMERAKALRATLEGLCETQSAKITRLVESHDRAQSDIAMLLAHAKGVEKMVLTLAHALDQASPGHPLVSPTGENGPDGEPLDGVDAAYEEGYAAIAGPLKCQTPSHEATTRVDSLRTTAIQASRDAAARRARAFEIAGVEGPAPKGETP